MCQKQLNAVCERWTFGRSLLIPSAGCSLNSQVKETLRDFGAWFHVRVGQRYVLAVSAKAGSNKTAKVGRT